jgi:hypothetical protein
MYVLALGWDTKFSHPDKKQVGPNTIHFNEQPHKYDSLWIYVSNFIDLIKAEPLSEVSAYKARFFTPIGSPLAKTKERAMLCPTYTGRPLSTTVVLILQRPIRYFSASASCNCFP